MGYFKIDLVRLFKMAEITKIERLDGKNYQSWKYNIKLVLMECSLWEFVEGTKTAPGASATATVQNAYRLRLDKAYSLIAQMLIRVCKFIFPRRPILVQLGKLYRNSLNLF